MKKQHIIYLVIGIAALVLAVAFLFLLSQYVIFQPKQQRALLNECLESADFGPIFKNSYNACVAIAEAPPHLKVEYLDKMANCPQPALDGISFSDYQKIEKEECFKRYPQ